MSQRGQAIVESIIVLPVLMGLLFMAHWLLYAQHEKSRVQLAAAHGAFLRAQLWSADYPLTEPQRKALWDAEATGLQYSQTGYGWNEALDRESTSLAAEVRLEDEGIHQSSLQKRLSHALFPSLALTQQHVVLVGSGSAVAAAQVRQRLEQAPQWWGKAADRSRRQVQNIEYFTGTVDKAWGRATPEYDWLRQWESSIPSRYERQE
ncbi:TadE family protein [Paenalcaligenes sp. Me131]|uniref:TadE family protein n=1 Tax=Paenalcaligenes sp. Me131 TaxID=3392636 RepID=UPI003D29E445